MRNIIQFTLFGPCHHRGALSFVSVGSSAIEEVEFSLDIECREIVKIIQFTVSVDTRRDALGHDGTFINASVIYGLLPSADWNLFSLSVEQQQQHSAEQQNRSGQYRRIIYWSRITLMLAVVEWSCFPLVSNFDSMSHRCWSVGIILVIHIAASWVV